MNSNGDSYSAFLERKSQLGGEYGFEPIFMPDFLFDFQKHLEDWALRKGRSAIFADCGMGKSIMELVWAQNVAQRENKAVLVVMPLAVSHQMLQEAEKFGIECARSTGGSVKGDITVTNYERLHHFRAEDFAGVVCDESSILKNFDGVRKKIITEFLRLRPYRLLATATPSPNDYIELGTSSEALGELGYMDMLGRFFKNDQNSLHPTSGRGRWERGLMSQNKWRFKRHAEQPFWRWICSWARALRRPSDLGYDDGDFVLPPLIENQVMIDHKQLLPGELFHKEAVGLYEQRQERRLTIRERCEKAAELATNKDSVLLWCHLNGEGDRLEEMIADGVQISGSDSDEHKEETLLAFASGQLRCLITKPKIAGFGMNFQRCAHVIFFPSHSFEQYYQGVRRCWRFGQTRQVRVDIVTTPGEASVLKSLQRKAEAADKMFSMLVMHMTDALRIGPDARFDMSEEVPSWL